MSDKWDLFISYATEDKAGFVKPLALLLSCTKVKVWYDEFSLEWGDSLSRSIDKGLAMSNYGIVVISRAFMAKQWPEYELRGLVALEISSKAKRIIPIWHGVTLEEVAAYSPSLADKLAGDTSQLSIEMIALRIIKIVRPDIYSTLQKRLTFLEALKAMYTENMQIDKISPGPIRHNTLPDALLRRIHLIYKVIHEVSPLSLDELISGFRRDLYPQDNVEQWETLALAYANLVGDSKLEIQTKKECFQATLLVCTNNLTEKALSQFHYVTIDMLKYTFENTISELTEEVSNLSEGGVTNAEID